MLYLYINYFSLNLKTIISFDRVDIFTQTHNWHRFWFIISLIILKKLRSFVLLMLLLELDAGPCDPAPLIDWPFTGLIFKKYGEMSQFEEGHFLRLPDFA